MEAKPLPRKKRIRTLSQAIDEIAKSFNTMGESQERRSEIMMQAEKERHAEFIAFQREQAELNRQHELKMLEIIMNHSNPASQNQPPQQSPFYALPQVQHTHPPTQISEVQLEFNRIPQIFKHCVIA